MQNLLDLQNDFRIIMNQIIVHQNKITEILSRKSNSRKHPRYSIIFPLFYDTESFIVEISGINKSRQLDYDLIGKVSKNRNSNITDEDKIVIAQTYYYKASNEIYCKQLSAIELCDESGDVIWPPSVVYDFYLMNKVICKMFHCYICNSNAMIRNDVCRMTI